MRALLAIALLLAAGGARAEDAASPAGETATDKAIALLKTGTMSFDVTWNGISLGDGVITLSATGEKGCYRYESVTKPIGPVRWIYGSPYELSLFCVRDGRVRPSHYEYHIDKRPRDGFTLDFDWAAKKVRTVKDGKTSERELPDVAYDRFGVQQAIRLWAMQQPDTRQRSEAEFLTVDDRDINHYRFAILGHEPVETPVGTLDAVRIDRVDSPTRSTHSWVAPSRDWQVIQLESINRGNVELRMLTNR